MGMNWSLALQSVYMFIKILKTSASSPIVDSVSGNVPVWFALARVYINSTIAIPHSMASFQPIRVYTCVWKCIILSIFVLHAQGIVAQNDTTTALVQQDWGCDHVLYLTELASKPGLQCTDFVNTFNFGELDPAPSLEDRRPGVEVNFHNQLFNNHTVPTSEDIPYGFAQVYTHLK